MYILDRLIQICEWCYTINKQNGLKKVVKIRINVGIGATLHLPLPLTKIKASFL